MTRGAINTLRAHLPGVSIGRWIAAAVVFQVLSARFNVGYVGGDEHFQLLEFAWFKLGHIPASYLPWEFAARIRPGFQVLIVTGLVNALQAGGIFTPFFAAFLLRLLSGLLGLWVSVELCARALPWIRRPPLRMAAFAGSLLLWIAPLVRGRYSSESWGGALTFAGVCLALDAVDAWPARRTRALVLAAATGLVWGVAFYCRFQMALPLAGAGLWLLVIRRAPPGVMVTIAAAFLAACGLNVVVDHWLYGEWVVTPYRYFVVNLLEGRAATFGVSPWWVVAVPFLVVLILPYSFVLVGLLVPGCWYARRNVLVWTAVPFVVGHALIAHKEVRFMFPMVFVLAPLVAVSVDALPGRLAEACVGWWRSRAGRINTRVFGTMNAMALVAVTFAPVHEAWPGLEWLWNQSRDRPLTLYTFGGSPWQDRARLSVNFYRPPGIVEKPVSSVDEFVSAWNRAPAERAYVFYRGLDPPAELAAAGVACTPEVRTLPPWLVRMDVLNLRSKAALWTICRPTIAAPTPSRRPASQPPSRH